MRIEVLLNDFAGIRRAEYLYVDKTRFLREWWERQDRCMVVIRPPRFGKTLLLSTVRAFFDPLCKGLTLENGAPVFEGLDVWKDEGMRAVHGTVPVISLTFSGVKEGTVTDFCRSFEDQVLRQYERYLHPDLIPDRVEAGGKEHDPETAERVLRAMNAFSELCLVLEKWYGNPPIVLMDAYDAPLMASREEEDMQEISCFLNAFYDGLFSAHPHVFKWLMTGTTGVGEGDAPPASFLPVMDSLQNPCFPTALGYTKAEVRELLRAAGREDDMDLVLSMYGGYRAGGEEICHPHSVNSYLQYGRAIGWWSNASGNGLVRNLIRNGPSAVPEKLIELLEEKSIRIQLPTQLPSPAFRRETENAFVRIVSSGYLTADRIPAGNLQPAGGLSWYEVRIPNGAARNFMETVCRTWFDDVTYSGPSPSKRFCQALLASDPEEMTASGRKMIQRSMRKGKPKDPVAFFWHGLVLVLLFHLKERYFLVSRNDSGGDGGTIALMRKTDPDPNETQEPQAFCLVLTVRGKTDPSAVHAIHRAVRETGMKGVQDFLNRGIPRETIRSYAVVLDGQDVLVGDGTEPLPRQTGEA